MLASCPASMVNQKQADLGIPNRFNLTPSRFSSLLKNLEMERFVILSGRCWDGAVELDVIF